ncbi:MAG: GIY-YIG nuclease family protein [Ignavibacteria bacterium]
MCLTSRGSEVRLLQPPLNLISFRGIFLSKYFVYIIQSLSSNLYYIGHTSNLPDRLLRHNGNRNKFTRNKGPWELIAAHTCNSKSEAYRLELKLKGMKNSAKAIEYLKKLGLEHSDF